MIPWCTSSDFNFGCSIGSLKDPVIKQKGKFVFALVFIINGGLGKHYLFVKKRSVTIKVNIEIININITTKRDEI